MTDQLTTGQSATTWAREHGEHFLWSCALDNYNVTRNWASGDCYRYTGHSGDPNNWIIDGVRALKDYADSNYLLDDGHSVQVFYVAGWHPDGTGVIAHPFPLNFDENGEPRLRAVDNRPVDFANWMLGPRRSYHLKIRRADD